MKKTCIVLSVFAVFFIIPLTVCTAGGNKEAPAAVSVNTGVFTDHYAAPRDGFASGEIPKADLDAIVQTAVRAPSAANRQPWFFTVIQDEKLAQKIVPQAVQGNVVIVISTEGNAENKITNREIIDCGLATQSIYLAAQALGYGSRIYTGPVDNINNTLKGELGFPGGRDAVAAVWVGRLKADAVSGASSRKAADETVTYK